MIVAQKSRAGLIGMLAGFLLLAGTDRLPAQSTSMFGNRGPAGQIGSNLSGSPVGRSTTMGANSTMSGQTLGGNNLGFNSFGNTNPTTRNTATGAQGGFIGRQETNTGLFAGNSQASQGANRSNARNARANTARRSTNQNSFNQFANQESANQGRQGRSGSNRTNVRPQQRIAFDFPARNSNAIESTLKSRFGVVASRQAGLNGVTITSEAEGVVVLSGEVNSEDSKRLAGVLARIEPGVRSVRNELTVREALQ